MPKLFQNRRFLLWFGIVGMLAACFPAAIGIFQLTDLRKGIEDIERVSSISRQSRNVLDLVAQSLPSFVAVTLELTPDELTKVRAEADHHFSNLERVVTELRSNGSGFMPEQRESALTDAINNVAHSWQDIREQIGTTKGSVEETYHFLAIFSEIDTARRILNSIDRDATTAAEVTTKTSFERVQNATIMIIVSIFGAALIGLIAINSNVQFARSMRRSNEQLLDKNQEIENLNATLEDRIEQRTVELKMAHQEIETNMSLLKQAAHMAQLGNWVWDDIDDRYIYCSEEVASLYGYSVDEFIERYGDAENLTRDIHPDDCELYEDSMDDIDSKESTFEIIHRERVKSGEYRHFRECGQRIYDEAGRIVRTIGFSQDITQYKETERALTQARQQAEAASRELEESMTQLSEAQMELVKSERLSALGQVTATMSHEIRNPLGAIRGSLAIVREMANEAKIKLDRPLDRIERSVSRCDNIIGDFLEYSRTHDLSLVSIDVSEFLNDLLDEQSLPEGIHLTRDVPTAESQIVVDPDRFRRVIINLVDNAAQAIKESDAQTGEITVSFRHHNKGSVISVRDNGPGIPDDVRERIFEPLFTTKSFGAGLGLATVKQLIEQHGAQLNIDTEVGVGTTFSVVLPSASTVVAIDHELHLAEKAA